MAIECNKRATFLVNSYVENFLRTLQNKSFMLNYFSMKLDQSLYSLWPRKYFFFVSEIPLQSNRKEMLAI